MKFVWRRESDGRYISFDGWMRSVPNARPEEAMFEAGDLASAYSYRPEGCVLEMLDGTPAPEWKPAPAMPVYRTLWAAQIDLSTGLPKPQENL